MFRIGQVVLMAMAIALGTAAAWRLTAGIYGQTVSSTVGWPALAQAAAVFIGCSGFCILFNVHGRGMLLADIGGMLSWMVYLLCTALGCDVYAANLFAAVFAALYSETMARVRKCPAVNYLVISTLPMLPGAGVYYTMSLGLEGRMMDSVAKGRRRRLARRRHSAGVDRVPALQPPRKEITKEGKSPLCPFSTGIARRFWRCGRNSLWGMQSPRVLIMIETDKLRERGYNHEILENERRGQRLFDYQQSQRYNPPRAVAADRADGL